MIIFAPKMKFNKNQKIKNLGFLNNMIYLGKKDKKKFYQLRLKKHGYSIRKIQRKLNLWKTINTATCTQAWLRIVEYHQRGNKRLAFQIIIKCRKTRIDYLKPNLHVVITKDITIAQYNKYLENR